MIAAMIAAVIAAAPTTSPRPATIAGTGSVYVSSLPTGCEVWVDGAYVGHAPVFVDVLQPGHHSVTISRAGWKAQLAAFDVGAGQMATVSVVLTRSAGRQTPAFGIDRGDLLVRGAPVGAAIFLDGQRAAGAADHPKKVAAGRHVVTVKPRTGAELVRLVTVYPDTTTVAMFADSNPARPDAQPDILAPLDQYVSAQSYTVAGSEIAIHYRGVEVQCAIGSRAYSLDGRAGMLSTAPALVEGRIFLPLSLLERIVNQKP